ncbi:hypothetical protein M752DRAFT_236113 [Aspergillus phoenicis ATCC 13157]|uniref:Zn(2)-C6 fungal-type domain-containing protein n=1 Tax=Aspergillus phoenicis ATCC 13157 TaxID=1353007 RepID=A0A370PFS6_ASPPH|nr:hypothetical protein M752DRAFT_236113 [Aspergillus phoenicis ATCC 13157]
MSPNQHRRASRGESQRSRKGCPACRRRKIKCDEQKPECGQCLRSGRSCRIIDSLFRPHAYTLLTASSPRSPRPPRSLPRDSPVAGPSGVTESPNAPWEAATPPGGIIQRYTVVKPRRPANAVYETVLSDPRQPSIQATAEPPANHPYSDQQGSRELSQGHSQAPHAHCSLQGVAINDSYEHRCEVAFFLRCFSEGPGRWLDFSNATSYFSRYIVTLAELSPLVRYSACALAAKQLGHVKDPESSIQQTPCHQAMSKIFADTKLNFLWYGAKYYERAIRLLARQISHDDQSNCYMSPTCIYQSGLTPQSVDYNSHGDQEIAAATFRLLAACILIVSHKRTRLETNDLPVWRNLGGLPLDDSGALIIDYADDRHAEQILARALIRLLCQMVNANLKNILEWNWIHGELGRWHDLLPSSFLSPVKWPPPGPAETGEAAQQSTSAEFTHETWFSSDTCAIAMALYHMARMVLLINQPLEMFLQRLPHQLDLLGTYRSLQDELHQHASQIVAIAHGMPSKVVRKHLLQPLYVAGRCLHDVSDRRSLLGILGQIGDDLGAYTDYRQRDLCGEWGIPYEPVERDIVL